MSRYLIISRLYMFKTSQFRASAIQNLQSTLKRYNRSIVVPDPVLFQKFRNDKIIEMREKKNSMGKLETPTKETPIDLEDV